MNVDNFFDNIGENELKALCEICGFKSIQEARNYYKQEDVKALLDELDYEKIMTDKDKVNYLVRLCWDLRSILKTSDLKDKQFLVDWITDTLRKIGEE